MAGGRCAIGNRTVGWANRARVLIPPITARPGMRHDSRSSGGDKRSMPKILVIDDDETLRRTLTATLEKNGFEVLEAATGATGVHLARTHLPDLVLCDVNMAGVGGHLALYALRRDPKIASIPFVLMSGFLASAGTPPGTERGADGFLAKPFDPEKLLSTIREAMSSQGPGAEDRRDESPAIADTNSAPGLLQPLNQVLKITGLLRTSRQPMSSKDISDMAGRAHQAAENVRKRIENCLLYAEIERLACDRQRLAGLLEHQTGIRAVVEPVARGTAILSERSADLALKFEDALVAISVEHLKKIAQELVDNAFRFSHPGSAVHVMTAPDAEQVALSISDHGCGLTPDQIVKAVAPITLDEALLTRHGSGLGLCISKRLTELYNGSFTIQAEPGRGATVTVRLPKPRPQ